MRSCESHLPRPSRPLATLAACPAGCGTVSEWKNDRVGCTTSDRSIWNPNGEAGHRARQARSCIAMLERTPQPRKALPPASSGSTLARCTWSGCRGRRTRRPEWIHARRGRGLVRVHPGGKLAGSRHVAGLIENRGTRGGSDHLNGGSVQDLDGESVKQPSRRGEANYYNW